MQVFGLHDLSNVSDKELDALKFEELEAMTMSLAQSADRERLTAYLSRRRIERLKQLTQERLRLDETAKVVRQVFGVALALWLWRVLELWPLAELSLSAVSAAAFLASIAYLAVLYYRWRKLRPHIWEWAMLGGHEK